MAEELKGQLAENLPGAINMFANALTGGDVSKLLKGMEGGEFKAKDLAKVSTYLRGEIDRMGGAGRSTMAAEQGRLTNAIDMLMFKMNSNGLNQGMGSMFKGLTEATASLNTTAMLLPKIMSEVAKVLADSSGGFARTFDKLLSIADSLFTTISSHPIIRALLSAGGYVIDKVTSSISEGLTGYDEALAISGGKPSALAKIAGNRPLNRKTYYNMMLRDEISPSTFSGLMIGDQFSSSFDYHKAHFQPSGSNYSRASSIINKTMGIGNYYGDTPVPMRNSQPAVNVYIDGVKTEARAVMYEPLVPFAGQ